MESIADYFIHVRDTAFLQGRFDFIKKKALGIYSYSRKLKRPGTHKRNSLQHYSIAEEHPFDFILIAHALAQYSYMARCLGIFGEELKYKKESERIAAILGKAAFDADPGRPENEFIYYNLFAGFPFRIEGIPETAIRGLLERMRSYFSELPLIVKSLGLDTFASLVAANNLLLMSDAKANDIVRRPAAHEKHDLYSAGIHESRHRQGQLGRRRFDGRQRHGVRDDPEPAFCGPS